MIRALWLALLVAAWWLLRAFLRDRAARPPGSGPARGRGVGPKEGGTMVRDRVCNTFVPRERAIVMRQDDVDHYFCSETCRSKFLAGAR